MREYDGFRLDESTKAAWRRFQGRLADHLAGMVDEDILIVEVLPAEEAEEGTPYLQFCGWGEGYLRAEASSNEVLAESRALDEVGQRALLRLGFEAPTHGRDDEPDSGSMNFHIDGEIDDADRLAFLSVRALRDVFGVPHPAFLVAEGLLDDDAPAEPSADEGADELAAVFPTGGPPRLQALVDAALTPFLGRPPVHDDDGDIAISVADTVVFVHVHESVPVVEMYVCLAAGIEDGARAAFEVGVLNRDTKFVKFRLVDDSILASVDLPSWPFAPEQLRAMLSVLIECVERLAPDLEVRVSAPSASADDVEEEAAEESVDPVRRAGDILLQLDADEPGSVGPHLAAGICGFDADVILALLRDEESSEIAWRTSRDQALHGGDLAEVAACAHEMDHARRSVALLRKALRLTVERQVGRDDELGSLPPPGRAQRAVRRRRVPDPTLEEVDPEIWG